MELDKLSKVTARPKKRLGRGTGSGKGKTAGRGTKGQKARENVPAGFIGGTLPLYRKLPFRRGLGNLKRSADTLTVSLEKLSAFGDNSTVDLQGLIDLKIINSKDAKKRGVKIVGNGEIKVSLTVALPISSSAAAKIEKAGGKIVCG